MDMMEDDFLQKRRKLLRVRAGLTDKDTKKAMQPDLKWQSGHVCCLFLISVLHATNLHARSINYK